MDDFINTNDSKGKWGRSLRNLHDDILTEILLRLPLKPLARCGCVCKYLYSLINSPSFISLHLDRSKNNLTFIVQANSRECKSPLELAFMDNSLLEKDVKIRKMVMIYPGGGSLHMVASCNGLVCFECTIDGSSQVCILNPLTRDFVTLPQPIPSSMRPDYGFGFDALREEFKVVRVSINRSLNFHQECEIFTLGTSSWRRIGTFPQPLNPFFPIFADGAFHWMIASKSPEYILSIHTSDEKFQQIKLPELLSSKDVFDDYRLVEWKGHLSLFSFFIDGRTEIWILRDCNRSMWIKEYNVNLLGLRRLSFFNSIVVRNHEILLVGASRLVSYNLNLSRLEEVDTTEIGFLEWPHVHAHVDSMVSSKHSYELESTGKGD